MRNPITVLKERLRLLALFPMGVFDWCEAESAKAWKESEKES
jgi:hypothetical protein